MTDYVYKKVSSIIFGMLSPEFIRKMAAAKIVTPELYDKEGYPVDGGLMDTHLGIIDPGLRCKTCAGKLKECAGHFGHIELARPVVHIKYAPIIYDVLRSTCRSCSRVLLSDEDIKLDAEMLLKVEKEKGIEARRRKSKEIVNSLKSIKKCPHCNEKQYVIKIEKPTTFFERDKRLSPIEVRLRLEKIPDNDLLILGFNYQYARPEWGVLTAFPIPPVTIRPSITLESGERSEDDLTHKLGDIVRINQRLFENINAGAPEIIIEDLWDLLQYHITTYFDNSTVHVPPARHRSGQALKTITERIKSKEGRFRHNLAGKRVNFAARSVVSPDTEIKFNEVGIPKTVAMELTVPEIVTEWNLEYLKELIKKGPDVYPGANYVSRQDGKKKKITEETKVQLLEELAKGYVVERHLIDGDIAIFNRQPSLHRMSIMCHKIKILTGKSFRLNPSVCVAPDTKVIMSEGYLKEIKDLKDYKNREIITCNWKKDREIENSKLKNFFEIDPRKYKFKCYEIITETGRKIKVTEDHPFYTNRGILKAKEIQENDKVTVYPINLPEYEEKNDIVVTEEDIINFIPKNANKKHIINTLKELNLLPLKMNNPKFPILTRLLAHIFGDGSLGNLKGNKTCRILKITFRGELNDLIDIKKDINKLGFNDKIKIVSRISKSQVKNFKGVIKKIIGVSNCFCLGSQPLGSLFLALSAPLGRKTNLNYRLPKWLFNSPLYIQRNFLATYFGSELSRPRTESRSKKRMAVPVFKIQKREDLIENGKELANDFINLLKNFNIKSLNIKIEDGNIRKDNSKTYTIVTEISSKMKNIMNLFGKIGYIYANKKEKLARLTYHYLENKDILINKQIEKFNRVRKLYSNNILPKDIAKELNIPRGTVSSWLYRQPPVNQYTSKDFLNFDDFIKISTKGLSKTGVVWEKIKERKEIKSFIAQDITTSSDNHNFFANGFLTKNCEPYNADFDGDEMNLHIPQSEEARAEADVLMQVQTQIISPKNGKNIIGCIEDSISGIYLLTKSLEFSREDASQILISIGISDFDFKKENVSGKEIFSVLLPKDFDYIGYAKKYTKCEKCSSGENHKCPYDTYVVVKNGQLLSGIIDSNTIGTESGGIITDMVKKYGEDIAIDIIGKIFRLGIKILLKRGFTTGLYDTDLNEEVQSKINVSLKEAEQKLYEYIDMYKKGKLEALPGKTIGETLEIRALEILNKVRNKIGNIITDSSDQQNATIIMALSGAKGNLLNLAQMSACVGQQALAGKRIDKGYENRTLSIFKEGDLGAEAKGFVRGGFKGGLKPFEFFFHAMTGRDALMDTALRTPKSGYLYRRLSNALQDIKVEYDGTVRDANKSVIQFKYGEDNVDVSKSKGGKINYDDLIRQRLNK
ncbi:hypothetical protein HYX16_01910 [Candidatus Woesearchaeota archaeon]|nr:hypothetical protein [Candidatus Woesearchaeota archaeon]